MIKKLTAILLVLALTFSSASLVFAYENDTNDYYAYENEASENNNLPPLYSWDYFFDLPDEMGFSLTRDGLFLYYLANPNDDPVHNIFRREIATGESTQITFEEVHMILGYFLKGNTLIIMRDTFGDEIFQLWRVGEDGQQVHITPWEGVIVMPMDLLEDVDGEILVMMNLETPFAFNVYRLNIYTSETVAVLDGGFAGAGLLTDSEGIIRGVTIIDGVSVTVMYRSSEDVDFDVVGQFHIDEFVAFVAFDANDEYVFAISNYGRNTDAIVRINPATLEEIEVIFVCEEVDTHGVIIHEGEISMIVHNTPYRQIIIPVGGLWAEVYESLVPMFDERYVIGISSVCENYNVMLVSTFSDISRGGLYIVNREAGTKEQLVDRNRGINPGHMAPMLPITYTARDGLTITGYLTLPIGIEPFDLPLVVNPHGGPWMRDMWGWNNEVQFLANRGYAVFQPNFRGSAGFGREFLQASYGQWGLTMQDDITDGVLYLIERGIVDPDRVGIYGASYGGYAALAGAAFTPELYAAVISYVGVSNIFTLLADIPPWWENQRIMFDERVGHPVYDYDRLFATSPVFHADNIIAPLFIAHGAMDPRVLLSESLQIVNALEARGVEVEFFVAWDEGHGFRQPENNRMFYTMMEAFFAEHLGGRTLTYLDDFERPLFDTAPLADWLAAEADGATAFSQEEVDAIWTVFFELTDEEHIEAVVAQLIMLGLAAIYTIAPGDTLSGIANELGVPVMFLLQVNGLNIDSVIWAGQELLVPVLLPTEALTD